MTDSTVRATPVRPASTVLALRSSPGGLEVLMVRRARGAEFMGDAFVFPGGAVDEIDQSDLARQAVRWGGDPDQLPWRAAGLRELMEEAGLAITIPEDVSVSGRDSEVYRSVLAADARLDADRLAYLSNWVTPVGPPRRFDARFFVVEVESESSARADTVEVFDETWISPQEALSRSASGRWNVPFPTIKHLELLDGFSNPAEAVEYASGLESVPRVQPQLVIGDNGGYRVLLPGEPGFDQGADE